MKRHISLLAVSALVTACSFAMADQTDAGNTPVNALTAKKCAKKGQVQVFDLSTTAAPGTADSRWAQTFPTAAPATGKQVYPGWTTPISGVDHWVEGTAGALATFTPPGTYSYATSITLPTNAGFVYLYSLTGTWSVDNTGKVLFDNSVISTCPSFVQSSSACFQFHIPFTASGIAPNGVNTLQIDDTNFGGPAGVLMEAKLTLTCAKRKGGRSDDGGA